MDEPVEKYYGGSEVAKQNAEIFDRYEDNDAVYKGFVELKKNASRSMLLPDQALDGDAKINAQKEVLHKLGAPKDADGLDLGEIEMVGSWTEDGVKTFKQFCAEMSLQPWQAKGLYNKFLASEKASIEASKTNAENADQELKRDWGPKYDDNMKGCNDLVDKYFTADFATSFKELPVVQKLEMLKGLKKMQDDFIKEGSLGSSGSQAVPSTPFLNYDKTKF